MEPTYYSAADLSIRHDLSLTFKDRLPRDNLEFTLPDSDDPELAFTAAESALLEHFQALKRNEKKLVKWACRDSTERLKSHFQDKRVGKEEKKALIKQEVQNIYFEMKTLRDDRAATFTLRERIKNIPYAEELVHAVLYDLPEVFPPQGTGTRVIRSAYQILGLTASTLEPLNTSVNAAVDGVVDGVVGGTNWLMTKAIKPVFNVVADQLTESATIHKIYYTMVANQIRQAREGDPELNAVLGSIGSIPSVIFEAASPVVKSVKDGSNKHYDNIKMVFEITGFVISDTAANIPDAIERHFDVPRAETLQAGSDILETAMGGLNAFGVGALAKTVVKTAVPLAQRGVGALAGMMAATEEQGTIQIFRPNAPFLKELIDVTHTAPIESLPTPLVSSARRLGYDAVATVAQKSGVEGLVPTTKVTQSFERMMSKMPDLGDYGTIHAAMASHVHRFHNAVPIVKDPFNYVRGVYPQLKKADIDVIHYDKTRHITQFSAKSQSYTLTTYKASLEGVSNSLGLGILQSFNLLGIKLPQLLAVGRVSEGALKGSFVLEPIPPGKSVGQMMKDLGEHSIGSPERKSGMQDLLSFSKKFGDDLAELNSKQVSERFPLNPEAFSSLYNRSMDTVKALNRNGIFIDELEIESAIERLCHGAIKNPGGGVCGIDIRADQFNWFGGQIHLRSAASVPGSLGGIAVTSETTIYVPLIAATQQYHKALDLFRIEGASHGLSVEEVSTLSSRFRSSYEAYFESTQVKPLTTEGRQFFEVGAIVEEIDRKLKLMSPVVDQEIRGLSDRLVEELRSVRTSPIQKIHDEIDTIARQSKASARFPMQRRLKDLFDQVDGTELSDSEILEFINKYFSTFDDMTDIDFRKAFTRRFLM